MKILVAVKRVIDYNVQIRVKEDGTGVVTDNVKMSTNPPDDNAIEEAVKIKEAGKATEVVAVTVGEEKAQETVRKALAVGADRGIHVKVDGILEPLAVSKILQKIVDKEKPDLVFMGKQAIDDDCNQTGQMLSALLNWPQATFASKIDVKDNKLLLKSDIPQSCKEKYEIFNSKPYQQMSSRIKGRACSNEKASDYSKKLLKQSKETIIYNISSDVNVTRELLYCASKIYAVVDHYNSKIFLKNVGIYQRRGYMSTTLTEVKNKSDVIILFSNKILSSYKSYPTIKFILELV